MYKFSNCAFLEAVVTSATSSMYRIKVVLLELGHGSGDGIRRRPLVSCSILGLLNSHCVSHGSGFFLLPGLGLIHETRSLCLDLDVYCFLLHRAVSSN